MKILNPNTGEDIVLIVKNHIFVYVTDYNLKALLMEIIVAPGQHHWEWIKFNPMSHIDISDIGNRFSTFENAINNAVNDLFCTVYEFVNFDEIVKEWDLVKYIDSIKTIYKEKS